MRKNTRIVVVVAAVAVVAAGGAWWMHSRAAPAPAAAAAGAPGAPGGAPAVLVTVVSAKQQDVPITIEVNGSVQPINSVDVRPQVSNMVQKVHVKEGQFVRAGELLFTLDDRADRANLDKATAQQQKDQATLGDLERQYKRSQELVEQKFIAQSAADNSQSQVQAQRAAVAADAAAVQSARVALGYDTIRSPASGRIGAIAVFAGSLVQPTSTLLTVTQLDPIAVSFPVPEGSLQDVLLGVKNRTPVAATATGAPKPTQGVLSFVDNTVDPTVGTVRAKATFDNKAQQLWPGQYVTVRATTRVLAGVTVIPSAAIVTNANGKLVYVVDAQQTAQPRKVQVNYSFGEQSVVAGVQPGDRVVMEGKQNLRPGSRVRLDAPRAPGAGASGARAPGAGAAVGASGASGAGASGAAVPEASASTATVAQKAQP